MWRFIATSFALLGLAFYVLSGGAEYEPVPGSLQAMADRAQPQPRTAPERPAAPSRSMAEVEATMESLRRTESETETRSEDLSVTLATTRMDGAGIIAAEANRPKGELLTLDLPDSPMTTDATGDAPAQDDALTSALAAALGQPVYESSDLRWVKENMVDLRAGPGLSFDTVTHITKGTEVAVIEDPGHGWLKVQATDNYQTGWVAEWLLVNPE